MEVSLGLTPLHGKIISNKKKPGQFSLWSLWCIRQIGEAYNTITPLGTLGGEPVKAQLLKERHGLSLKQGMVPPR